MNKVKKRIIVFLLILISVLSSCEELRFLPESEGGRKGENNILRAAFSFHDESGDRPLAASQLYGETYYDDRLIYNDGSTLIQYNVRNNTRTVLCDDPLCRHNDSSCPFFGYLECRYYDGKWYFLKRGQNDDGSTYRYYSVYDPETGEENYLNNNNGAGNFSIGSLLFDGDYMYYFEVILSEENADGSENQYLCTLNRLRLNDGSTEKILEFPTKKYDYLLAASDHRIVLCETGKGLYYINADALDSFEKHFFFLSDDPEFGYRMDCCQPVGDLLLLCEENGEDSVFYTLTFTGEKKILAEVKGTAAHCYFTNGYVYFRITSDKVIGKMGNGSASDQLFDLKVSLPGIYRMDYSGNVEPVFPDFPENSGYDTVSFSGDFTVIGNYIYSRYTHYGKALKDVYEAEDYSGSLSGLMRIDITTKEIIYVSGIQ